MSGFTISGGSLERLAERDLIALEVQDVKLA
jgi:hypothetical protein